MHEKGWLIKNASCAAWLRIQHWIGKKPIITWTVDASIALRFARRSDAEEFWLLMPQDGIFPIITEHKWESIPQREQIMNDAQIKHMVNQFLSWRLPENFHPDGGISFHPEYNVEYSLARGIIPPRHQPTGTNLFTSEQAETMMRHMLNGLQ